MKRVAIFDFDHTLVQGDSFWPFLTYAVGKPLCLYTLLCGLASYLREKNKIPLRDFLKAYLLNHLLKGKKLSDLAPAVQHTKRWQKINVPIMQRLLDHKLHGDIIVIASGGLDLYLPALLSDVPYDALICTDIGVQDNIVTGDMIHGNCVRIIKAQRVGAWLLQNGPFDETFGYGNYPHDLPMLDRVKHRVIVS